MPAVARGSTRRSSATSSPSARPAARPQSGARAPLHSSARPYARRRASLVATAGVWTLAALAAAGLAVALAGSDRAEALTSEVAANVTQAGISAGFAARSIEIQGAAASSRPAILAAARVQPGDPILNVDLAALRGRVEGVGTVDSARVVRLLPDTLVISVTERPRLAVWQRGGTFSVIDPAGRVIREASAVDFPNLPLVVGADAAGSASFMLEQVARRPRLRERLRALVRVDGRRWDLRMTDGGLILLPASTPETAMVRLDELDRRTRLLELGFARVDLRNPDVISVRPRPTDGAPVPVYSPPPPSTPTAAEAVED